MGSWMAGYWQRFFCVFMDRDEVEVSKSKGKSVKDLLYGIKHQKNDL